LRSYNQFCPAARALDVVGDRWTLLIVRDLLFGPKRYSDLQAGLPGIGPTLLTERLRALESAGVVERSSVYQLTELGEGLRPVLDELFGWGLQLLGAPGPDDVVRASWLIAAIGGSADAERIPDKTEESYELRVGEEIVTVEVDPEGVKTWEGAARAPAVVFEMDLETFAALGTREMTGDEALHDGRLVVDGDAGAAARASKLFGLLEPDVASSSS